MCRCHCRLLDFAQKGRARAFATAAAAHPSILLIPPRCRPASRATSSPQWSRGHAQASQPAKHRACSALALALALLVRVYLAIGPAPAVVGPHGPCGFARESPKGGRQAGRAGGSWATAQRRPAGGPARWRLVCHLMRRRDSSSTTSSERAAAGTSLASRRFALLCHSPLPSPGLADGRPCL